MSRFKTIPESNFKVGQAVWITGTGWSTPAPTTVTGIDHTGVTVERNPDFRFTLIEGYEKDAGGRVCRIVDETGFNHQTLDTLAGKLARVLGEDHPGDVHIDPGAHEIRLTVPQAIELLVRLEGAR